MNCRSMNKGLAFCFSSFEFFKIARASEELLSCLREPKLRSGCPREIIRPNESGHCPRTSAKKRQKVIKSNQVLQTESWFRLKLFLNLLVVVGGCVG